MKRVLALAVLSILASMAVLTAHPGGAILPAETSWNVREGDRSPKTNWKSTTSDSLRFLYFQHGYRIAFQEKTRAYLGGNFFKDYATSVKGLGGWRDGDSWGTNYILHPMQGAASGFIFLHNNPEGEEVEFGQRRYWKTRLKAFAFAALYSTQFEIGPFSEAAIGNVGKRPGTMTFVDFVVTPIGGLGWMIAEDILDRFVIRKVEGQNGQRKGLIRFLRVALNPTRSFANVMRFRLPWYRRGREINGVRGEPGLPGSFNGLPHLDLEADVFGAPKEPFEFYDVLIPEDGLFFMVMPVENAHAWEVSLYSDDAARALFGEISQHTEKATPPN